MSPPAPRPADLTVTPPLVRALLDAVAEGGAAALPTDVPAELWQRALVGPAGDFLARPGKEFRARLTALSYAGMGGEAGTMPAALPQIVELLHAGSLIVDDIEDASAERRGAPALHHVVGTPLALNTGNWMYFWALALIPRLPVAAEVRADLGQHALATMLRCHQGQALDLAARVGTVELRHLPAVVAATTRGKTAALMGLAARLGAACAGARAALVEGAAQLGEEMGLALQQLDDLGGLGGPTTGARHAKGLEDVRDARPTWAWAWLAEAGDELAAARLQQRVRSHGGDPAEVASILGALADAVRPIGRARVAAQLDVVRRLIAPLLEAGVAHELSRELARLEASYG